MANYRSSGSSGYSGSSRSSGKSSSSSRTVSAARLHQHAGASNTFGGVTKVNHNNGTFSMKKQGK
jgi:hypothetical protein